MRSRELIAAAVATASLTAVGPAAAESKRFALSMMHFNVQYVAGGLKGFLVAADPSIDLDAEQVEDAIVRESFEPVLDMFAAHPTWGADIELQGYMLDVMAARHGEVLDKLRALAKSGQIEVVSFHYSDQLFMAFPPASWEKSAELDAATFAKHDVPLGSAVFCQEGQAGIGMAGAMAAHGYQTLVFPKNLWGYQLGDGPTEPIYRWGDARMITSRGGTWTRGADSLEASFWFVDDGELLATGDFDPYIAEHFKKDPAAIAATEAELAGLEAGGFDVATVSEFAAAAEAFAPPADPPALLDGTWQPSSTDGISRWLGGFGLWWVDERDNDVRTLGAMAQRELLAAEAAAAAAGLDARAELDGAWRLLALGLVSDASGINPFRGEIEYGIAHATEALRIASDVVARSKTTLGLGAVAIDTSSGTVVAQAPPAAPASATAPLALVVSPGDRSLTQTWTALAPDDFLVDLAFGAGDERTLTVTFPGTGGDIVYTPGLASSPVHVPRAGVPWDHFELALSDGLVGLGGDVFAIKDQAMVHVAATVLPDSGDVRFHDDTVPSGEATTWRFHVVTGGEARAAEVARSVNVTPKVWR